MDTLLLPPERVKLFFVALLKLPSLQEIADNPSLLLKLPYPIAHEIFERFKHMEASLGGYANVPSNPVEMAISRPRYKWMDSRHLHYIGDEVAGAVEANEALLICTPPQHGKSSTCSIWTPFWYLVKHPDRVVLLLSYEKNFARKWGRTVRDLVLTYGKEYGLELDPKQTAADDWALTTGGGMSCSGAGGSISGRYVGLLIVDDAIKNYEEAHSETIRESTWDWWEGTVIQRIQPDTAVIVIGTRWHEDDLIGRLIKRSENGTGIKFRVVVLPAVAGKDDPLGRPPGEGLWGAKGQPFYSEREQTLSSYKWSSIFQQAPSPPGGLKIDPDWWKFYRPSEFPDPDQEIQSWDLALDSVKETDSYMCGGVLSRKGALVFLRDGFHEHCDINKVISTVLGWNRIYPKAKQKLVERAISGNALAQMLRDKCSGMLPWPPKGTRKGSKEMCLDACSPDIRSGNVLLPIKPDGSKPKWVEELIEEMRQFPRAPHDDWVDMMSQGINFLLPSARRAVRDAHDEALAQTPAASPPEAHTVMLHAKISQLTQPKLDDLRRRQGDRTRTLHFPTYGKGNKPGYTRTTRRMW